MYLIVPSPFAFFCFVNSMMSSSVRDKITSSSVVSTTENATDPLKASALKENSLQSPLMSAIDDIPASSLDLALNCND